jgi:hypothetical protein
MLALMRPSSLAFPAIFVFLVAASSCKKTSAAPRACTADGDCVIGCNQAGDCCGHPYCESAQHADDAREAREENQKHCTDKDRKNCPSYGARRPPNYDVVVHCKASQCVAEHVPKAPE